MQVLWLVVLVAAPELEASTQPECVRATLPRQPSVCGEAVSPGWRAARIGLELLGGALLGAPAIVSGAVIGTVGDHAAGREATVGLALGSAFGAALGTAP